MRMGVSIAVSSALFLTLACETRRSEYADVAEAERAQAGGITQLSQILPKTARKIVVLEDRDLGLMSLRFEYGSGNPVAGWWVRGDARVVGEVMSPEELDRAVRGGWWPAPRSSRVIEYYHGAWRTRQGDGTKVGIPAVLAVDRSVGMAYYRHGYRVEVH